MPFASIIPLVMGEPSCSVGSCNIGAWNQPVILHVRRAGSSTIVHLCRAIHLAARCRLDLTISLQQSSIPSTRFEEEAILDLHQVTQLLTWLDEEHRKDKATLAAMRSQIDTQKAQLTEQARQFQEIQATLARIEGNLPKLAQLESSIQNVRTEFSGLLAKQAAEIETLGEKRTQTEQTENETLGRIVRGLQERVESLGSFDNTVIVLREEDSKLRSELTRVFTQVADVAKHVDTVEQRVDVLAQDPPAFRDALTNLRLAHEELSSNHIALRAVVEALGPRLEAKFEQVAPALEEINRRRRSDVDAFQTQQQELVRQIDRLSQEIKAAQMPLVRWAKQLEEFGAEFERNRKTLYDLRELDKQVRQQATETLELQRLATERLRAEVREWQDSQVKVDEEQAVRVGQLEAWQPKIAESLHSIEERLEQNKRDIGDSTADLWQAWSEYMREQTRVTEKALKRRGKS